jgi:subfamily B ATP-binding cassette protein MsbA
MTLLVPFLNLLFSTEALVTVKPELSLNADSLIQLLNYYISKVIIEQGQMQALIYICIILIVAFFLRNLTRFFAMFYMANVRIGSVKDIRNAIYKKILILPLSFYNKHRKGDIISRVTTDVQEVEYSIMNYLEMIVRDPITILTYIAFMFSVSPQLTLFVLVLLPITGLLIGQIGKSLRKSSIIGQARMAGMMSTIEETISGLRIIKAFSAINYSDTRFKDQNNLFSRLMVSI